MENECPVPTGILILIGGKEKKAADEPDKKTPGHTNGTEILKKFVELTAKQDPLIEVVTTASEQGDESFEEYRKIFMELGAAAVGHIHHNRRHEVLEGPLLDRINNADGIFFAGGDQLKYTSIYGGTALLTRLKQRYIYDKIVIAGTSAGAMALSTPMIYAGNEEAQELSGEIKVTTGLEFLKDVCIDTHFVNRGRFVRMAQVILTNPTCIGMGVGEDTAIIVSNGLEAAVIGSGLIIVIDGFHIGEASIDEFVEKKPFTVRDLKVHILSAGDSYIIPQINPPHK